MAIAIRGTTPATSSGNGDPTSISLTGSRQPQTDDVLIIIHCNDFYTQANIATPTVAGSTSGVTAITNGAFDGGTDGRHTKSFYYVVTSTGDKTVAVDETGSADEEKALIVYVLSGADTAAPIDIAACPTDGVAVFPHVIPSISPTSSDAFLICHMNGNGDGGATTPPGTMTEQYDIIVPGTLTATGGTQQLSSSGATGTRTYTSVNLIDYVLLTICVKTSSGGGGPAPATPLFLQPIRSGMLWQ